MADHFLGLVSNVEISQHKTIHLDLQDTFSAGVSLSVEPKISAANLEARATLAFGANPPVRALGLTSKATMQLGVTPPELGALQDVVNASLGLTLDRKPLWIALEVDATITLGVDNRPLRPAELTADAALFFALSRPAQIYDFSLITNTDTYGFSQYNWPVDEVFGSIGISEEGVYSLSGADDNGAVIDAHIELPWIALGNGRMVRIADIMALGKSNQEMELQVSTIEEGSGMRYCYTVECNGAELNELYVQIGRGMRSHLTNLKLVNKEGGDFQINDLSIRFVQTGKRRYS